VVIFQFLLFLLVGSAIWAAGLAPEGMLPDAIFPSFIVHQMPAGVRGLLIAGILAAAMSTISSSINALASSVTYDFYAGSTGRTDPAHLLRLGRIVTVLWGVALTYILAARWHRAEGRDVVIAAASAMLVMLLVVFARSLVAWGVAPWLAPFGRLAWPWYVPLGTTLTILVGVASSLLRPRTSA